MCKDKDVRLITVYYDFDEKQPFSYEDVITFKGNAHSYEERKKLVQKIFKHLEISYEFSAAEWVKIDTIAKGVIAQIKSDQYKRLIENLQPDFELVTDFIDYKTKVKVRCRKCGTEWENLPDNLKFRKHCPRKCDTDHIFRYEY